MNIFQRSRFKKKQMMNNASLESFGDVSFALINHPMNQPMHLVSWLTIDHKIVKFSTPFKYLHINKWDVGCVLQVVVLSPMEVPLPNMCL
jgi:hypothetical protein